VRSNDVRFTYRLYTDSTLGANAASQLADIDSVTTPDSLTAVFWFKHRYPEQFFDATYQMFICPEHLLAHVRTSDLRTAAFGHQPVGDGQFRFASWTPSASIAVVADTANYRGRPKLDRIIISIAPSFGTAFTKLLTGDADYFETVHPEDFNQVRTNPALRLVPYDDPSYGFLWFNLKAPKSARPNSLFANRALRRALGMALDRDRMVRNVFDSFAVTARGPFALSNHSADTTADQLPYDTARANRLLDSLGWRRGPDGVRRRDGRPLAFPLLVPVSSKNRMQFALLIQDQLARVGAHVTIDQVDFGEFANRLQTRDFDAAIHTWKTDPSLNGVRQAWTRSGEGNGANFGSYESAAFDAEVDSALAASDSASRHDHFHRAYAIITNDAPAVWLYQAHQVAGAQRRIHVAYLRPDEWWAHLAEWYVPIDERLPRDRIGLGADAR
jgi:peptide/nickel transport system substrate-binding protein